MPELFPASRFSPEQASPSWAGDENPLQSIQQEKQRNTVSHLGRLSACVFVWRPSAPPTGVGYFFFLSSPSCLIMSAEEHAAGANLRHLSATACLGFCRLSHQQEAVINVQRHLLDPTSISSALKRIELNQQTQEKPLNYWKPHNPKWNKLIIIIIIIMKSQ